MENEDTTTLYGYYINSFKRKMPFNAVYLADNNDENGRHWTFYVDDMDNIITFNVGDWQIYNFKKNVLDKNIKWTYLKWLDNIDKVSDGTWTSYDPERHKHSKNLIDDTKNNNNIYSKDDWEKLINYKGGSSRKPKRKRVSTRRKTTKRRRSLRNIIRKTKKMYK